MDRTPAIARLREYFDAHAEGIVCAYLFGSTARGEARTGSDIDVGVLLEKDPARRIRFEVRARSLFFDLKPILDQYRRKAPSIRG